MIYTLCCELWDFAMDYYYGETFEEVAKQAHDNGYEPNGTDYIALIKVDDKGCMELCLEQYFEW